MKKTKIILAALLSIFALSTFTFAPVYAADCEHTTIIKVPCGNKGEGIWEIVNLVLSIMTYGVGALAIIGMVVAGIMYMSSGDSPEGSKKAKTMILNITVGLLLYGMLWALLNWLIPGGVFT